MNRFLRALLGALIGALVAGLFTAVKIFGAVTSESIDPSQKARVLGQGISEAMNFAAVLIIGGLVVGATIGLLMPFRRPPGPPEGGV